MFGYQIGLAGEISNAIPSVPGDESIGKKPEDLHVTPTPTNQWSSTQPNNTISTPQYSNPVYGEYHAPPNNNPRWVPATSAPLAPTYQHLLHSNQSVPQSHHSGLIFVDPAMGGGGLPTAVAGDTEEPISDDQAPLPHPIDWDLYQQMLTFDPSFEVYMGGPTNRQFLYDRGDID